MEVISRLIKGLLSANYHPLALNNYGLFTSYRDTFIPLRLTLLIIYFIRTYSWPVNKWR